MRLSPAPYRDVAVNLKSFATELTGMLSRPWERWMSLLEAAIKTVPSKIGEASLTAQAASIGATAIPTSGLGGAYYRISFYARVTQAATTSSSLIVTVGWTDGGVACTGSTGALTGNTTSTSTGQATAFRIIKADPGTAITYATTYASVGATPMQYSLYVMAEELP